MTLLTRRARLAFDLFTVVGATAMGSIEALPRLVGHPMIGHGTTSERPPRVAIVTDTIDDINGVAIGLRRLAVSASHAGLPLFLVGAGDSSQRRVVVDNEGIVRVPSLLSRGLAFYPEMRWSAPQVPALVDWLEAEQIDVVQCATPGPLGFAAMAAARALGLPCIAQYHTEVAAFAERMSGDRRLGSAMARVTSWFYRHADVALAPSRAVHERLVGYGVAAERIVRVPRGVDLAGFSPNKRNRSWLARYGLGDGPVVLYAGRLSREKNLDVLLDAFAKVRAVRPHANLLLVGDGPHAKELHGPGVVKTGMLTGDDLATAYASSDVFAMPSEIETFGNVVVEAQAAGLPVVVATAGAAREQMVPGQTGLVVDMSRSEPLAAALIRLIDDQEWREDLGQRAHRFSKRYDQAAATRATFAVYRRVLDGGANLDGKVAA